MSVEQEITRVAGGTKDTLKALINKFGGTVNDEKIDAYPSLVDELEIDYESAGAAEQALSDSKAYTDEQIGAIPTPDVSGQIDTHNTDSEAHTDIREAIDSIDHVVEVNHKQPIQFWCGTKDEYDAVEEHDDNVMYIVTDDQTVGGEQAVIEVDGILKGDGTGNVTAAVPGVDYVEPTDLEEVYLADVVSYSPETRTEEEQLQAQQNIGIADAINRITTSTTSPTRQVTIAAEDLQTYIDSLPRLLTGIILITVSGTVTEQLQLYNFYGNGGIQITATNRGGCIFQKGVSVISQISVSFTNCTFSNEDAETASSYDISTVYGGRILCIDCDFIGNGVNTAFNVSYHGLIHVYSGCTVCNYRIVAVASYGGFIEFEALAANTTGNGVGAYVWHGGTIMIMESADQFLGGSRNNCQGGLITIGSAAVINEKQAVRFDAAQSLTATQQAQARANIGADISYGTDDLTAGTSTLATGKLYVVYE